MKKTFAIVAVVAVAALLIVLLAAAAFAVLLFWPLERSAPNYREMGDAVLVNYTEQSFYVDNGTYEINSTDTTVILDMTRGSISNTSDGVIVSLAGGSPMPGDFAGNTVGRIIIALAGSSAPVIMPVTRVTGASPSQPGSTWTVIAKEAVPINGNQSLASYNLTLSSPNGSLLNASLGSDQIVPGQILVVEPGTDYATNGPTRGYNNEIRQGQESWFESDVAGQQTTLKVDVRWRNPANKLRLMIYTPDGHALGPYYDDSDTREDGRINVDIANPEGITGGEWHYKVYGIEVQGKDDYYVRTV